MTILIRMSSCFASFKLLSTSTATLGESWYSARHQSCRRKQLQNVSSGVEQTRYQLVFIVRHIVYRNSLLSASNFTCRISEYWCNVFCTFPRSSATSAAERCFDVSVVKALQSQAPFDCVKCAACSLLNIFWQLWSPAWKLGCRCWPVVSEVRVSQLFGCLLMKFYQISINTSAHIFFNKNCKVTIKSPEHAVHVTFAMGIHFGDTEGGSILFIQQYAMKITFQNSSEINYWGIAEFN